MLPTNPLDPSLNTKKKYKQIPPKTQHDTSTGRAHPSPESVHLLIAGSTIVHELFHFLNCHAIYFGAACSPLLFIAARAIQGASPGVLRELWTISPNHTRSIFVDWFSHLRNLCLRLALRPHIGFWGSLGNLSLYSWSLNQNKNTVPTCQYVRSSLHCRINILLTRFTPKNQTQLLEVNRTPSISPS